MSITSLQLWTMQRGAAVFLSKDQLYTVVTLWIMAKRNCPTSIRRWIYSNLFENFAN